MDGSVEFRVEHLDPARHRRDVFRCESPELTDFIQKRARKEMEALASVCFVVVPENDTTRIVGYYTLSQTSIALAQLPEAISRKLPRYPVLGATLIGRLARDLAWKGGGIGPILLTDALRRCVRQSSAVGAVVVVTDPKDERARGFYSTFGFRPLDDQRLFLPMREVADALARKVRV